MRCVALALLLLTTGAAPPAEGWSERYQAAHQRLEAGDFAAAAEQLEALLAEAPDETHRARVEAELALAKLWAGRGVVLVRRADLGEETLSAKAANERTTDELVVLYINSIFYGIGSGVWVSILSDADGPAGVLWPTLGFAAGAAGGVALLDNYGQPFGYGVPQSISSGLRIGLMEGATWAAWNEARARSEDTWTAETTATVVWGASTLGGVAGGLAGQLIGTTPGRASWVESTAMWSGLVFGFAGAALADERPDDVGLLAGAISLNLGAAAGLLTAGDVSPRVARVRFLDLGGLSGALLAGGLYLAIADEGSEARPALALTAGGAAAGLAAAWFLTAGMTKDVPEPSGEPVGWSITPLPGEGTGGMLGAYGRW